MLRSECTTSMEWWLEIHWQLVFNCEHWTTLLNDPYLQRGASTKPPYIQRNCIGEENFKGLASCPSVPGCSMPKPWKEVKVRLLTLIAINVTDIQQWFWDSNMISSKGSNSSYCHAWDLVTFGPSLFWPKLVLFLLWPSHMCVHACPNCQCERELFVPSFAEMHYQKLRPNQCSSRSSVLSYKSPAQPSLALPCFHGYCSEGQSVTAAWVCVQIHCLLLILQFPFCHNLAYNIYWHCRNLCFRMGKSTQVV